jgi:hypothetical protein
VTVASSSCIVLSPYSRSFGGFILGSGDGLGAGSREAFLLAPVLLLSALVDSVALLLDSIDELAGPLREILEHRYRDSTGRVNWRWKRARWLSGSLGWWPPTSPSMNAPIMGGTLRPLRLLIEKRGAPEVRSCPQ